MKSYDHLLSTAMDAFIYQPESGALIRKKTMRQAGSPDDRGYLRVSICNTRIKVHRLVWAMHFGEFPSKEIDHINGLKGDNRISNLRDVEPVVNQQNHRKAKLTNKTGLLGVSPNNSGFKARIRVDGKDKYLGTFATPTAAHAAYVDAKRTYHQGSTL